MPPAQSITRNRFLDRLESGPVIVGDGGMGALLSAAVPRLRSPEEANLRAPDAVVSLHVSFINAGSELIETNTFGAGQSAVTITRGGARDPAMQAIPVSGAQAAVTVQ